MEPDSLFDLCLEAGCRVNPNTYEDLPLLLKEKLLLKLTKRGLCSSECLVVLVHPHLNKLDLRECSVSEESLLSLEGLKQLKHLYLPQPPSVSPTAYSEAALVKVIKGKPNLLSLGVNGHHGVSDRVISVLVGGSPDLTELHLQETFISNQALYCLASLSSLQRLNIARTKVNDVGLEQLALGSAGQSLSELRLDGCNRLTKHSMKTVCKFMIQLSILCFPLCPNLSAEESGLLLDSLKNRRIKQLTWTVY